MLIKRHNDDSRVTSELDVYAPAATELADEERKAQVSIGGIKATGTFEALESNMV